MPDVILELLDLEKTFPRARQSAVAGVSAKIRAGIVTGLVGPDGAGKTTLMRLMAGLLAPTRGQVIFNPEAGSDDVGQPFQAAPDASGGFLARRPAGRLESRPNPALRDGKPALQEIGPARELIGYMPQKFGLYEDLSVQENLDLHADLRGVIGEERAVMFKRLLAFTDLARFTKRLAGRLSGGMKQKLGLACALLGHPRLLLLDEPGVGVDPISRRELWKMVRDLIQQGLTVVWSTAYLEEAEYCEEVLLLNEGHLLFAGKPADLTRRVQNRCFQIRNFSASRRQLLARVLRRPEVLDGIIQGRNVRLVLRQGAHPASLQELSPEPSAEVVAAPPRFEDAFVDVLGGGAKGDSGLSQRVQAVAGDHETVLEASGLTKKFGDFAAADNISFAVKRGEAFGLLGPNGAGKSTTFRMMCGLLTPTAGSAHVMGIDLRKSPSQARQRLGYMAQKFSLYGNLTVAQNLTFFSGAYGLRGARRKKAIDEMLEIFGLVPFADSPADVLSLGFKQRLALACAVMHQPDILFLDEPTSGVDPLTRREFWSHINGLVEKGVTVMVTTHFMEEAEYCDRVALVFRGRIIATGTPDALKEQAATASHPEPSMEDAFIRLIEEQDKEKESA